MQTAERMNKTLFDIGAEIQAFRAMMDELQGDVSDEKVEALYLEWLQRNTDDLEAKLRGYRGWIRENEMRAAAAKEEADHWNAVSKSYASEADRAQSALIRFMDFLGDKEIKAGKMNVAWSFSGGKRAVTPLQPADKLPELYRRVHSVWKPDTDAIRYELEKMQSDNPLEPVEIEGLARLEPRNRRLKWK